jgi:hypothetical protein
MLIPNDKFSSLFKSAHFYIKAIALCEKLLFNSTGFINKHMPHHTLKIVNLSPCINHARVTKLVSNSWYSLTMEGNSIIYPFDDYVIWPVSLALMNCERITLRNLLMRVILQYQKVCVT